MSALILDANLKSSLAAIRSLGRSRVPVFAGATRSTAMGLSSRYVQSSFVYPDPKNDQRGFVEAVRAQAQVVQEETGERPVVFCFSDATYLSLARAYNHIKDVLHFPLPPYEPLEVAFDKEKTNTLAQVYHVPTISCYGETDFETVSFPAVVKPRHSVTWKDGKGVSGTAVFVLSLEELKDVFERLREETGEAPVVQECITGDEYGVECVCRSGKVLQSFAHKRIRSLSPTGGAAVVKETAPDTEQVRSMHQYAELLLYELQWTGPAMVEFKIDDRDGKPKLMEINGRFWGSLPLPVRAGVDFPMTYYELAQGELTKDFRDYTPPFTRTRHFLGDCKWLLSVMFSRSPLRETHYPSRASALKDFLLEVFRSRGDVWLLTDPRPSFYELIDILKR